MTEATRVEVTERQLRATMAHHEKMARVFREYGQHENAESADRAAQIVRERLAPQEG